MPSITSPEVEAASASASSQRESAAARYIRSPNAKVAPAVPAIVMPEKAPSADPAASRRKEAPSANCWAPERVAVVMVGEVRVLLVRV